MLKTYITSFLLVCLSIEVFAQSGGTCNCSDTSTDKVEKLIALAAEGTTEALEFYTESIIPNDDLKVDPNLKLAIEIWDYEAWYKLKDLEEEYDYLNDSKTHILGIPFWWEKRGDRYVENYWIKTDRVNCLGHIINHLKRTDSYKKWEELKRKDKKEYKKNTETKPPDDEKQEKTQKKIEPVVPVQDTIVDNKDKDTTKLNGKVVIPNEPNIKKLTEEVTKLTKEVTKLSEVIENVKPSKVIAVHTIYFKEGEVSPDNQGIEVIKKIANTKDVTEITIEGFASKSGSRETNYAISMSRCYEVKSQILKTGYPNDFILLPVGETDKKDFRAVIITLKGR